MEIIAVSPKETVLFDIFNMRQWCRMNACVMNRNLFISVNHLTIHASTEFECINIGFTGSSFLSSVEQTNLTIIINLEDFFGSKAIIYK